MAHAPGTASGGGIAIDLEADYSPSVNSTIDLVDVDLISNTVTACNECTVCALVVGVGG